MDKIIAITGGIGCGKSTACDVLKKLGYTVFSADETYSELLKDKEFVKSIHSLLGVDSKSDTLEREKVSKIVFNDKTALKKLNDFTHDKIISKMFFNSKNKGVVFHEVPLLFEGGFQNLYSKIIVIKRDFEKRVESVIKRSNLTRTEVESRISSQVDYDKIDSKNLIFITNDLGVLELETELKKVIKTI